MRQTLSVVFLALGALTACDNDDASEDAGATTHDVGASMDAAEHDATSRDTGSGDATAPDAWSADAWAPDAPDAWEPDAWEPDAFVPPDATTCGNGVEDADERCCTDADVAALIASLVPAGAATRRYCVPQLNFGDDQRLCVTPIDECAGPACVVGPPDDTWSLSTITSMSGIEVQVDALIPLDQTMSVQGTAFIGGPYTCDVPVTGRVTWQRRYAIDDSGTHVVATPRSSTYDGFAFFPESGCGSVIRLSDRASLSNSIVASVALTLIREGAVRHACAY